MKKDKITKYLFFLILLIFPLGQLLRLDLTSFSAGLKVQAIDILVFCYVLFWLGRNLFEKAKVRLPPFFKQLLAFILIAFLSLLWQIRSLTPWEFLTALFYWLRLFNFVLFFWATVDLLKKEELPIFDYLLADGIVIAFFALLQYLVLPDTRFLFNFGWDKHYFRAIGTFLDPGFTGLLLVLTFIIWLVYWSEKSVKKNFFFFTAGFILILAIGLTFSRISYLSLFFILGLMLLMGKKWRFFLYLGVMFLLLVFLLPKPGGEGVNLWRTSSLLARLDSYKQTFIIIKDHPLLGVGYDAFRYAQRNYGFLSEENWQSTNAGAGTDNSFLLVFATTGIFGLMFFLNFWVKAIFLSFTYWRKSQSALVFFLSWVVLSLSAFSMNSLFYAWVLCWLMIVMAKFTVDNL